jgi:RNA polymerase sigma factor (sigma-70 family)
VAESDAELVARVMASGDRAAFAQLVQRHQSPVRNFFRRLTHPDQARADDLAQETFLKLFRSIGSFHGQAKFSTWLYRIAYNVFLDEQRKRSPPSAPVEAIETATPDHAQRLDYEADVSSLLRRLSLRQRAIFELHYRKDLSHQEIASALGIPLGTVKSDLSRGLAQLQLLVTADKGVE